MSDETLIDVACFFNVFWGKGSTNVFLKQSNHSKRAVFFWINSSLNPLFHPPPNVLLEARRLQHAASQTRHNTNTSSSFVNRVCKVSGCAADLHVEQPRGCLTLSPHSEMGVYTNISGRQKESHWLLFGPIQQDGWLVSFWWRRNLKEVKSKGNDLSIWHSQSWKVSR